MSAYVVDKETIDQLITGALRAELFGPEEANEKGQMLWRENVISVAYRYNLATRDATELAQYESDVEAYEYEPCEVSGAQIISSIDCLDYQSCEHDGWPQSAAYALLEDLRAAFPARLLRAVSPQSGTRLRLMRKRSATHGRFIIQN